MPNIADGTQTHSDICERVKTKTEGCAIATRFAELSPTRQDRSSVVGDERRHGYLALGRS